MYQVSRILEVLVFAELSRQETRLFARKLRASLIPTDPEKKIVIPTPPKPNAEWQESGASTLVVSAGELSCGKRNCPHAVRLLQRETPVANPVRPVSRGAKRLPAVAPDLQVTVV